MTIAILPMNVKALRVSKNDSTALAGKYKGRTARFELMPHDPLSEQPSTGEAIYQSIVSTASPANKLAPGMHIHWELPDLYKRGHQSAGGGDPVFPHAPNFWLVTRYLRIWDVGVGGYGAMQPRSWIVESDFISDTVQSDACKVKRPAIAVPLPAKPKPGELPFRYMGRVVDYDSWNGPESVDKYLPYYKPNYLTSIGFVGPAFSSYYPECSSVFGFWDHFKDVPEVYDAIHQNHKLRFKASYQVLGWVGDAKDDALAGLKGEIFAAFDGYVAACAREKTSIEHSPADELVRIGRETYRLDFNEKDIRYETNSDHTLRKIDAPGRGLCNGWVQEIVWDMLTDPTTTSFLNNPPNGLTPKAVWSDDQIRIAVGNTTVEGLSALIKDDIVNPHASPAAIKDYEVLLNALQLGLLHDFEASGNALMTLEEALHTRAFSKTMGGYLWTIEPAEVLDRQPSEAPNANREVTLPLPLAEVLTGLNRAQKSYDQGRAALDEMRKQLFMDWLRFIEAYDDTTDTKLHFNVDVLMDFIDGPGPESELAFVAAQGKAVGLLDYTIDPVTGVIVGIANTPAANTSAGAVLAAHRALLAVLGDMGEWLVRATPAPAFWTPTDPVLVMEGDRLQPVLRNGEAAILPVRLDYELFDRLRIEYAGQTIDLRTSAIPGRPDVSAVTPMQDEIWGCIGELFLLAPMLAGQVADGVAKAGGNANPAIIDRKAFIETLNAAQGGLSPLEPPAGTGGLFARQHALDAEPTENPREDIAAPQKIGFTFSNSQEIGWTPYAAGWSAQERIGSLDPNRYDPFLPVFLVWTCRLDPMVRDRGNDYGPDALSRHFELDPNGVDYTYPLHGGQAGPITTGVPVEYGGAIVLSRQPTRSLSAQIEQYRKFYPGSDEDTALETARKAYDRRQIVSQSIDGFNRAQTLREGIARIRVEDLVTGDRESITADIDSAATADSRDDWYRFAFNALKPIPQGLRAQDNFGPFRGGFGTIHGLEIVDAFGQRMILNTKGKHPSGAQRAIPSHALAPAAGDTAHADDIFFPPRLLPPARVWFKGLSAAFDPNIKGFDDDFVEMNDHPATSPVCGWVVPNKLDRSLFFYTPEGAPIGSFGLEHGDNVYRTRAGNLANPRDLLDKDIGPSQGPALVNRHLFDFMWYLHGQNGNFLAAFVDTIETSEHHMVPANFAQNVPLSVLMGQPLALTRAVLALETLGGTLPLSQADYSVQAVFSQDVLNGRFRYADRQAASSAALGEVQVPIRLGNLEDFDDGLIGYLIETKAQGGPYTTFFAPAAPQQAPDGIARPEFDTLSTALNEKPITLTVLMDPRGAIHATTGILPVDRLAIPPDQYERAMSRLELTFFTHPVLDGRAGLALPLPEVGGFEWSWVQPGAEGPLPLAAKSSDDVATYNFSPQTLREGWTRLARAPTPGADEQ